MARTALAWIIAELRRKVFDTGPEDFDDGIKYAGDTIRLNRQFKDIASAIAVVTNPTVQIWSPSGIVKVTAATPATASTATGMAYYDYAASIGVSQGVWRIQFTGSVAAVQRRYSEEFSVRQTQRFWSDDELQNYLDRHRIFIGGDETREKLTFNAGKTIFASKFDNFESPTIYIGATTTGTVTPDSSNLVAGEFTFTSAQSTELYLEGHSYNILLAAAECLEELAADLSRAYQWSRGGVSQQSQNPFDLAQSYRNRESGMMSVRFIKTY